MAEDTKNGQIAVGAFFVIAGLLVFLFLSIAVGTGMMVAGLITCFFPPCPLRHMPTRHTTTTNQQVSPSNDVETPSTKQLYQASVVKETAETKVGIFLIRFTDGTVRISKFSDDSLFANSDLKPGMTVLTINGEPCPNTVNESVALIKATSGLLTIQARE